ncbi:VOC family protein [Streptomyces sp. NPDC002911]
MEIDLHAGIPVGDLPPSFVASDVQHADHAMHTIFVDALDDLDDLVAQIGLRGLEPTERETFPNGVRTAVHHDPDGNRIGFGGAQPEARVWLLSLSAQGLYSRPAAFSAR